MKTKPFTVKKGLYFWLVIGFSGNQYKSGSRSACYRWIHSVDGEETLRHDRELIDLKNKELSGEIDRHNEAVLKEYYEAN